MSKLLPFPTTADLTHARRTSPRRIILGLTCFLTVAFLITQLASAPSSRIDVERLNRIIEHDTPQTKLGAPSVPLTSLGLEADESYHLGTIDNSKYHSELQDFVKDTFPDKLQGPAIASIDAFVPGTGSGTCTKSPSVPPKIWQTSKNHDPDMYHEWKEQPGYGYTFLNDAAADKWVQGHFGGSKLHWAWDTLGPGILRADLLRYLLLLVEGGIYTDTDTHLLKSIDRWGEGATNYDNKNYPGQPGLIVGIEADVGEREDWHRWWARPIQLCQWTFASTPLHPVLIDAVRRIYNHTGEISKSLDSDAIVGVAAKDKISEMVTSGEYIAQVMEWTGPGVFTDSVMRYLAAGRSIQWPSLKSLRAPLRICDIVILPVTGFSPGVQLFGAGEPTDPQAMVHHMFAGSWKRPKDRQPR